MPFFIRKKQNNKRREPFKGTQGPRRPKKSFRDEEITSDEDDENLRKKFQRIADAAEDEVDEEEFETAQEKKVRLAQDYLKQLKEQKEAESSAEEDEESMRTSIGQVLRDEVLEAAGKLQKPLAQLLVAPDPQTYTYIKSKVQNLPITCVVVSHDGKFIFSGSKDSTIAKYSIDGKRLGCIKRKINEDDNGHSSHVQSLAVSSDNQFLASGDNKGFIHVWNFTTLEHLKTFKRNKSMISGLVFRHGTHTLYSCSYDRMVMVWNLDVMGFVEHLGGHASYITGIDALSREACITSGGRDETVIIYQIVEDKQLIFNGRQGSIDGIKLVNDKTFVTYGQDGSLALWSTTKKKPHYVIKEAHGLQPNNEPHWLTAVAALVNSDVVATGSSDGFIKFWKVGIKEFKTIQALFSIPLAGFINSLAFTSSGSHLIAGVGQEHKLGRWYRNTECKNCIVVIPLSKKS